MAKKFSVYKPNKRLAGAAFQFDFNPAKESVFVEAALQSGEQQFDWQNKIVVKLSAADISKLLVVLEGKSRSVELFHDSTKTVLSFSGETKAVTKQQEAPSLKNTSLSLTKGDYGFFIKASRQFTDGKVSAVNMPLSDDEAVIMAVMFKQVISKVYGW